jgi:hypothetical protein
MKTFSNVNQLWDYFSNCIVCGESRKIDLSLGPDIIFKLIEWTKVNNLLKIKFSFNKKKNEELILKVDCDNNQWSANFADSSIEEFVSQYLSDLYYYIHSDCTYCNCHYSNSSDIELTDESTIDSNSIGVETEGISLLNESSFFDLQFDYTINKVIISNSSLEDKKSFQSNKKQQQVSLPLIDFDFSNKEKVISKIGTILSFK